MLNTEPQNSSRTEASGFGRDLAPDEWRAYHQVIENAKQALGIHHLGLITPIRSLPSDSNTGTGSLPGAKAFFQFISSLGFDTVQVDPEGKTKLGDASPYTGTVFSTNPLYVDLKDLAENPAWAGLLNRETLAAIEQGNPNPDGRRVAYEYIYQAQEGALREVYANFQTKLQSLDKLPATEAAAVRALKTRFDAFVKANKQWLEPDALYECLSQEYGNDYWPHWKKGENATQDRNLYNAKNAKEEKATVARIETLKKQYADVLGAYEFTQFILKEQKEAFKAFAKTQGFAVMADRQVGFSDRDVWAYQRLFLPDWSMGCPPDFFTAAGQAWGFPVLDPEQLFKPDGSLGAGGILLKRLFAKIFEENPGGVRIDHIIGLIDPWVYPSGQAHTKNGTRLYSSPEHPKLGKYAFVPAEALNEEITPDEAKRVKDEAMTDAVVEKYSRILDKLVMAAAEEKGIEHEAIICEDLGTLTTPVLHVLKRRGLSGIRVTQFVDPEDVEDIFRARNVAPHYWITAGTHDNESLLEWARALVEKKRPKQDVWRHADILTEDLIPDETQKDDFRQSVATDPQALVRAKFIELFAGPARQVQLFFTDLLGMEETYNRPGTSGDANWALRIPRNFREAYFTAVREGRGLNLPDVLSAALEAKQVNDPQLLAELRRYADLLRQ